MERSLFLLSASRSLNFVLFYEGIILPFSQFCLPSLRLEPRSSSAFLKFPSLSISIGCLGRNFPSIVGAEGKFMMGE